MTTPREVLAAVSTLWLALGCGATEPTPVVESNSGRQSSRPSLEDRQTRDEALAELQARFGRALSAARGDRSAPEVVAVADETVAEATRAYLNVDDDVYRARVLEYLVELRDPRALNAFVAALDPQRGIPEEQAVVAARALRAVDLPEPIADVATQALSRRLLFVSTERPVDDRIRIETIRTLGALGRPAAVSTLGVISVRTDHGQPFLVNRLAMETLGTFRDERALPYALEGLFLFEPGSPAMRMNDVAAMTLVRIGASVVPPLVALLRGDDGEVRPLVNAYIDAVHAQSPDTELSVARVVAGEAAYVLGTLGDPAAYDALLDAAGDDDPDRRLVALLALARLDIDARPANRVRALIESAYPDMPLESQAQLLGVIQRRIDPESLPFLVSVARGGRTDDVLRVLAFRAASLVALGRETRPLASIRLPDTVAPSPTLTLGTRCARDLDCWLGATEAADGDSLERVAYALARLGVDTVSPEDGARIRAALYDLLGHPEVRVRLSALTALDHLGAGRETATRIHQMAAAEEGRSTWRAFATAALPDAARFEAREARRVE